HRDRPGVETAEEGGDEVEPRREQEQSPLSAQAAPLQPGSESARPGLQLAVGEARLFGLSVGQEGVRLRVRRGCRPPAQGIDQSLIDSLETHTNRESPSRQKRFKPDGWKTRKGETRPGSLKSKGLRMPSFITRSERLGNRAGLRPHVRQVFALRRQC